MLIRVVTLVKLINLINLMPNCTLIMSYIVVSSYTLLLSLLNIKNQPYPAIDRLDTFILNIIPIKLFIVQRDVNIIIL